jgi:hypothetical protein
MPPGFLMRPLMLWQVWSMSRTYHVRPAALLGLDRDVADSYLAFAMDRAVWFFGSAVEHDMNQAEYGAGHEKWTREQTIAQRQAVWDLYMYPDGKTDDDDVKPPPPKGRFADPAAMIK